MIFNKRLDIIKNYPLVDFNTASYFLLPIKPEYHTNLLPDCILKTESSKNFKQNVSWQNAIEKFYIGDNLYDKSIKRGDIIVFYRTNYWPHILGSAKFRSVLTGAAIVLEKNQFSFDNPKLKSWLSRTVLNIEEIKNYKNPNYLRFLFLENFNKRITLGTLRDEMNLFNSPESWGSRGLHKLTKDQFNVILTKTNFFEDKEVE